MERRKTNRSSYVKLVTGNKDTRSSITGTNLHRSRSMRESIRKLKVRLNHPGIVQSPFKFNLAVHNREKHYHKFSVAKEESDDELDTIELQKTPFASEKYLKTRPAYGMDLIIPCGDNTIEDLMSTLPVPRKACKLLQIPETYCAKYLKEQKQQQHQQQQQQQIQSKHLNKSLHDPIGDGKSLRNHEIYADLSKSISQGIYGTTRHRTATIRKPMPYLNSNNILPCSLSPTKSATLRSDRSSSSNNSHKYNIHKNQSNISPSTDDDEHLVILRRRPPSSSSSSATTTVSTSTTISATTIDPHHQHLSNATKNFHNLNTHDYNNDYEELLLNEPTPFTTYGGHQQKHRPDSGDSQETARTYFEHPHHHLSLQHNPPTLEGRENSGSPFRWSEQLTQNVVSVAKIRSAISCTSQDLKEMEYLLPQSQQQHLKLPSSSSLSISSTSSLSSTNSGKMLAELSASTSSSSLANGGNASMVNNNSLSISRHSQNGHNNKNFKLLQQQQQQQHTSSHHNHLNHHHYPAQQQQQQQHQHTHNLHLHNNKSSTHHHQQQQQAKKVNVGAISNTFVDENNAGNHQNLAVYRQPATTRTHSTHTTNNNNKGGNTPHRSKMSKKQLKLAQAQLDKLTQCNLHLHALFSAVEHGHLDKARTILESTDVDVNSINTDGLSPLDVAVLSNNRSMTKMLLQHGALEGSQFSVDSIGTKLNGLLKDAEIRIHDLSGLDGTCQPSFSSRPSISSIIIGNTGSSVTGCTGNEVDKQIGIWERRVKGLRRLLLGWDQARPPDAPASVTVDVTGDNSIQVQILEPFEGAIGTKFKVQWSTRADFSNVVGERELMDWRSFHGTMGTQCHITGLTQGRRYFLRAASGNVKGWGPYKCSVPASVIPSSWRDLNSREDRYIGRQRMLDNLFTAVRLARPADVSELTLDTNSQQRRNPKKKTTIKQLFSVASKFQKHLRRGIYLASIVYCEDKILVTSEDFLPVIEIDESFPSTLNSDYHWLMKVACTWDDVKSLRTDMERNLTSANHFRTKLLSAVCQMQSALGFNDLGQLYYKPLKDNHGTVVLTCIQAVKSQKQVSILNSRWLPVNKLQKKIGALHEEYNINEILISSLTDQLQYHQMAHHRLSPGLYLGYLKMQCSMDQIQVVVPAKTPNVLPHCKVRDNSHISAEEWQVLKKGGNSADGKGEDVPRSSSPLRLGLDFNTNTEATTEVQRLFLYDLTTATNKLFAYMNIKPQDAFTHRLFDVEVIEHSKDISFLIICPSVELSCAVPGQSELLLQREDLASLSIQAFEMIHLSTYQPGIIQKYARLSCILELDTTLANHSQREAFSTSELQTAKERLAKLQELTASLNAVWKSVRWLMDVVAFARDKNAPPSAAMKDILEFAQSSEQGSGVNPQLLQPPGRGDMKFSKTGSGRGSWPGPGSSHTSPNLGPEHSKSEQNLGLSAATTPTASSAPTTSSASSMTYQKQTQSQPLTVTTSTLATPSTANLLQVQGDFMTSDISSLRKNSGDSVTSHCTTHSFYSANDSVLTSTSDFGQMFSVPPSRSDDTLSETAKQNQKQIQGLQRKRTSSNITPTSSTPVTPMITVHSSSSAPYLVTDPSSLGSSQSLKVNYNGEYESKQIKTAEKVKSASSANLRDNGLYLKSSLSALQTEMKASTSSSLDENIAPGKASTSKHMQRLNSQEEYTASSCPSLASEGATEGVANTPSGIIQVYTAYNTGLASGTSLKLHVTAKTSAREVINLVVKQLNMAAVLKGSNGPIYSADVLDNFCLVAVIGARERCLRDDFKPLLLQNPWKKGRLYVRQKHELLAAIEHSNRKSHLI